MFSADNISLGIGARKLLDHISFTINSGDRIGLVGVNGAGKSTLFKIIIGLEELDEGNFTFPSNLTIGYLPQEIVSNNMERSVWDEAASAFMHIKELEEELEILNEKIKTEDAGPLEQILEKHASITAKLEESEAYKIDSLISSVLSGLGFSKDSFKRPLGSFSGGWIMRANLARLLLSKPELLLLDEPTNHLDLSSVIWLEKWLQDYKGSVVIISHDQVFLDSVVNRIFELDSGSLTSWNGNYSAYIEQKDIERRQRQAEIKNLSARLAELERFIERFRSKATKAKQVQSRIKEYEKLKAEMPTATLSTSNSHFSFPDPERSGRIVVNGEEIGKSFDAVIFKGFNFTIERGDRIGVVGDNGAGKSTLAKVVAGVDQDFQGNIEYGHNVRPSYFAQHQAAELASELTVLETAESANTLDSSQLARDILGAFLFRGDDVNKKVKALSGGEKSRLALAKIMLSPGNFMVLDEPTNHLDINSRKALKKALTSYEGTLLIVSHDRFFMDGIVNKIWHLEAGDITQYPGTLKEYMEYQQKKLEDEEKNSEKTINSVKPNLETDTKQIKSNRDKRRLAAAQREEFNKKAGPLKKQISKFESDIEKLEGELSLLEKTLSDPSTYQDEDKAKEINLEYSNNKKQLQELYTLWENASNELEKI